MIKRSEVGSEKRETLMKWGEIGRPVRGAATGVCFRGGHTNSQLLAPVPVPAADDGGERAVGRERIVAVVARLLEPFLEEVVGRLLASLDTPGRAVVQAQLGLGDVVVVVVGGVHLPVADGQAAVDELRRPGQLVLCGALARVEVAAGDDAAGGRPPEAAHVGHRVAAPLAAAAAAVREGQEAVDDGEGAHLIGDPRGVPQVVALDGVAFRTPARVPHLLGWSSRRVLTPASFLESTAASRSIGPLNYYIHTQVEIIFFKNLLSKYAFLNKV